MKYEALTSLIKGRSIKGRFVATLSANIAKIGLSFITGLIIARGLGPEKYGNFTFLLASFASIAMLLDMGSSSAFYTFLSQRKRGVEFYFYYFLWVFAQFAVILMFICFIFPDALRNKIWLGQPKNIIILAFLTSFTMNKIWQTIMQIGESVRATIIVQLYNIILVCTYLCLVLGLYFLHYLTISNIFIISFLTYLVFSVILARRLKDELASHEKTGVLGMFGEFKVYCVPLIAYCVASFVYSFIDVWFLQKFGGATQQGFYAVGLSFSTISLVFTTSILNIAWKEIAEASNLGNKERLHYLYKTISRGLYFIGAISSCFLIPFSREILVLLLGPAYESAWPCLAIILLYPIYQSLGQMNATYFYATAQTKIHSATGIVMMAISVPVTYFVLAPSSYKFGGLGLGSLGLALKMVVLAIIGTNINSYIISRRLQWKYDFLYQAETIALLLMVSFVIKWSLGWIFHVPDIFFSPLFLIIMAAPIYVCIVGLAMRSFPRLAGFEKEQVTSIIQYLKHNFKSVVLDKA